MIVERSLSPDAELLQAFSDNSANLGIVLHAVDLQLTLYSVELTSEFAHKRDHEVEICRR